MLKPLLAGLFAAQFGAFASHADTQGDHIVDRVELTDIEAALTRWDYEVQAALVQDDVPIVAARNEEGLEFIVYGTACDTEGQSGCLGLMMTVMYSVDIPLEFAVINEANQRWAAATTTYAAPAQENAQGQLTIHRYVILDGGVTFQNIADNLLNLLAIAPQVVEFLEQ